MQKITVDDPESRSADVVAQNLDQLNTLFPEAFIDEKVDFQVLKQLLGSAVDEREEKYGLNWHGKRQARQLALTPSTGTLRPCPGESVDWDTTENLVIEGDNLEVLKLLQKSYAGKVKLIYIDPPYNTGNDFVYPDCYRDNIRNYLKLTGQVDGVNHKVSSNSESSGRFHTDWLSMMYPRLRLARQLLSQDGLIFVSIDDHEVFTLRSILDEIFGTENFLATVVWQKKYSTKADSKHFSESHEFLICYRKSDLGVVHGVARSESQEGTYKNLDQDPRGPWASDNLLRTEVRDYAIYAVQSPSGKEHWPPAGSSWRFTQDRMEALIEDNRIWFGRTGQSKPRLKRFRTDVRESIPPQTLWAFNEVGHTDEGTKELADLFGSTRSPFPNPKPVRLLQRVIEIGAGPEDIVLDFFGGSATLGHAVLAQNTLDAGTRKFIVVQIPELLNPGKKEEQASTYFCDQLGKPHNLAEITKERLRLAGPKVRGENPVLTGDLGFRVFKLDTSNIRSWDPDRDDLDGTLLASIDHIKPGRSEEDIFYELLLKLGLDLCVPTESRAIAGKAVLSVGAGTLITCLDERIERDDVEPLASGISDWYAEFAPAGDSTVVFRDSAFVDDVAKTNLTAILEQRGLGTVRSI